MRVWYHTLHSMLPREAVRVERADGVTFDSFSAAADHARSMIVGDECTYAPMRTGDRL